MSGKRCYLSIDAGLTSTKATAFDGSGRELHVVSARMPKTYVSAHRHDIDMVKLSASVDALLIELTARLEREGYEPAGIGVAAHGNGIYPVDASMRPVAPAIASSDSRAQQIVDAIGAADVDRLAQRTGSVPWAAQPSILLRWFRDREPETYAAVRWVLTCKDWLTSQLTGAVSADYSDASACGLVALDTLKYDSTALDILGMPAGDLSRFPPLHRSGDVVGTVSAAAGRRTNLPAGLPVIAGSIDAVAAAVGAGARNVGDVTIIVGTFAINAVVVPTQTPAPRVNLSAIMPNPSLMLAMEVAPTSATNLDWFARACVPAGDAPAEAPVLLREAASVAVGADGLLFLPFVDGAPEHPDASGTFLGISGAHRRGHLTRAVIEGVAQYHRVLLDRVVASGAEIDDRPWRLAGGGARSDLWAQIFADVLGRPIRRQLASELGAKGIASLVAAAVSSAGDDWTPNDRDDLCVVPGPNRSAYERQSGLFDRCVAALAPAWAEIERNRAG